MRIGPPHLSCLLDACSTTRAAKLRYIAEKMEKNLQIFNINIMCLGFVEIMNEEPDISDIPI